MLLRTLRALFVLLGMVAETGILCVGGMYVNYFLSVLSLSYILIIFNKEEYGIDMYFYV